jgi:very-short-patch-repair endonuclease
VSVEAHPSERAVRWAGLPVHGVVRVVGVDRAAMAVALDSPAAGVPAVIGCDVEPSDPVAHIVEEVLGQLTTVARELLPAWLPGGEHADGAAGVERRAVRTLARSLAASTSHYGPFLAALAEDALTGRSASGAFPAEIRARGLARVLSAAYRRPSVVVMLVSSMRRGGSGDVGTAAAWLADHGGFGVWLVSADPEQVDRFAAVTPDLPEYVAGLAAAPSGSPPRPDYPPVAGRPHPRSDAERRLEARLAPLDWARGRVWNQVHQMNPLVPPIRVDLMWPERKCAVELDGPDHRGVLKYADDRRRDNTLVLDGYAVLRFTNDDVLDDPSHVLSVIERLLTSRQKGDNQ